MPQAVHRQEQNLSPIQGRNGQQVHDRKVNGNEGHELQNIAGRTGKAAGLCARLAHFSHHVHNADGPGHVPYAHRAGKQVPQTQPHHTHVVNGLIPGVFQPPGYPDFLHHADINPAPLNLVSVFIHQGPHGDGEAVQRNARPVPLHLQVHHVPGPAQIQEGVGVEINAVAVHPVNPVPRQKPRRL